MLSKLTPLDIRNELGSKIRALRIERGEKQATAAKAASVSLEAYGALERGANCDLTTFVKVMLHFGRLQNIADAIYQGPTTDHSRVRDRRKKTAEEMAIEKIFAEAEERNRQKT